MNAPSFGRKKGESLVHYLPPASVPPHPAQTKQPTAGKWIFLQRSSDKKDRGRKGYITKKKGMKTERHWEYSHPAKPRISSISSHLPVCYLVLFLPVWLIRAVLYIRGLHGSVTFLLERSSAGPKLSSSWEVIIPALYLPGEG